MDYKIESSIPIPNSVGRTRRSKYPLKQLKPGDSFFVAEENPKKAQNLRSSLSVRAKKIGIKITSMSDNTGVRVWRTA